jgi:tetratricopeptide (TPR) repeat protein
VLDRKLKQALDALQRGDTEDAERRARAVLERAPRNPSALRICGIACLRRNDAQAARDLLRRAHEADPADANTMTDLGVAELQAGDPRAAEALLRQAMMRGRRDADVLSWLGIALTGLDRFDEAADVFRDASALAPGEPGLHLNLGNALRQAGQLRQAVAALEQALQLKPDYAGALNSLGSVLHEAGDTAAAVAAFRRAITIDSSYAEAHNNLGNALLTLQPAEAVRCFRRAIELKGSYADAHYNLGNALQSSGDHESAVASYRRAVELDGGHALAHHNLGNALLERGELEAASRSFREAIAAKPDYLKALSSLGVTLHEQGLWREAIASYESALAQDAEFADAQYNLAQVHLFQGDYERAWPLYERRVDCEGIRSRLRKQAGTVALFETVPRWGGLADTAGVGIWAEQGIGDQLLFSTLIPELIGAGVPFVYEVDGRLKDAYERAFPGQQFVALSDPPQAALARAPRALWAGSLPGVFRRRREDFARQPQRLLGALPQRVAQYRSRMDEQGAGLKVALSWRSSREDRLGPRKSTRLAEFAPLLQRPGVQFVDVQYGDTAAERAALEQETGVKLLHFDEVDYFNDLEGMLAIIEACDLVITTSNVNAHLAGALGKRTWLLYLEDRPPFHYWTHTQDDRSPWYPSVEIVTLSASPHWPGIVSHAARKLSAVVNPDA